MYTLNHKCERCGNGTQDAYPAKFSPDDKYVRYRIAARYSKLH
ncbi:MAG TPA: nucleolar RNA-binding Nop10p family protein [Nitrososphaeraceae archaeon]